jgi:outer membrane usher protein
MTPRRLLAGLALLGLLLAGLAWRLSPSLRTSPAAVAPPPLLTASPPVAIPGSATPLAAPEPLSGRAGQPLARPSATTASASSARPPSARPGAYSLAALAVTAMPAPAAESPASARAVKPQDAAATAITSDDEASYLPLTVTVNGRDYGVQLLREVAGAPCLSPENLRALEIPETLLPPSPMPGDCWPLPALAPEVDGELRVSSGELRLRVNPRGLPAQALDLGYSRRSEPAQFPRSGYLNYGLDLSRYDDRGEVDARLPLELGLRLGRWLARSTAQWQEGSAQRLYSSLQRDFPERLATLSLGDVSSGIGSVTGGASLAGLQWSRNFNYQPLVQRSPGLNYGGVLDTPSTVEVYIDDRKVSSSSLPAGPFSLQNLPVQSGLAGNARIEILDAFGQRRVLELPYFLGNGLLNAGESQFSYSFGLPRLPGGDAYQSQPAFVAAHRWGLSDRLTLGYQGTAADDLGLLGGELDLALGRYGQLGLSQFFGGDPDAPGQASQLGYRYAKSRFNFDSDYSRRDARFRSLNSGFGAIGQSDSWQWATRLGGSLAQLYGSLSYLRGGNQDGGYERYGANFGSRLGRLGSLNLQLQYDPRKAEPSALLTFSTQLRRGPFAQLGYDSSEFRRQLSARLSQSPAGYTGSGYRLELARQQYPDRDDSNSFTAELDLRRQAYTALLSRQQPDGVDSSRLLLAGSAVLSDAGLSLAQPVRGSFVSVEVEGLAGAEVYADGRRIGRTGVNRPVSVADLTPYLTHQVTVLLPDDLPIGTDLPARTLPVTLADGAGQRLAFKPRRLRLYEAYLRRADGSAVEYAPLSLRREALEVASTSGEGGYLYLQDLEPGAYRVEVGGSRPCRLELRLPEAAETYTALGNLLCQTE